MKKCYVDRKLIGEVLIEQHLITREQLRQALVRQKQVGADVYLGQLLVEMGFLSEVEIVTALVLQCNLPYIAVSKHEIVPEVLCLIPKDFARRERIVPLDKIGDVLSVVGVAPLIESCRERLESMTHCKIAVFITTSIEMDRVLSKYYGDV